MVNVTFSGKHLRKVHMSRLFIVKTCMYNINVHDNPLCMWWPSPRHGLQFCGKSYRIIFLYDGIDYLLMTVQIEKLENCTMQSPFQTQRFIKHQCGWKGRRRGWDSWGERIALSALHPCAHCAHWCSFCLVYIPVSCFSQINASSITQSWYIYNLVQTQYSLIDIQWLGLCDSPQISPLSSGNHLCAFAYQERCCVLVQFCLLLNTLSWHVAWHVQPFHIFGTS